MLISKNNFSRDRQTTQNLQDKLIDEAAINNFISTQGVPKLAPVTVVIAAYKEKDNIGAVVKSIPKRICGLRVSVLVIEDGKDDGTANIVRKAGGLVVVTNVNRGQGTALKLGYFIAREYGSTYIITADGDGQANPDDFAVVLQPIVLGEADFVNGSRRLGRTDSAGVVRNTGVFVFSKLATIITSTVVTDTANSIRAMRAELTGRLTLNEPQYQSPELLVSAIMNGARYVERPVSVRARMSGTSKKGNNFVYGYSHGKVFVLTWWREKRSRPLGS